MVHADLSETAIAIGRAETAEDVEAVRDLVRDFFRWAMSEVAGESGEDENPSVFANLETELAGLPGRFGPPTGCLLLARLDGVPVGCVAFYGQDAETMEIKRMFVRPEAWGHRIGKRLLDALLAEARAAGYSRYRLSTHRSLHHAHTLYRNAGFRYVPLSDKFPDVVEGVDICMEMMATGEEGALIT